MVVITYLVLISADLNPQSYESDRNRNLGKLMRVVA